MANLKDIKVRIANVATAEKVTFSMKNISAAKLSQVRKFYHTSKDYLTINKNIIKYLLFYYQNNILLKEDDFGNNFFNFNPKLPKLILVFGADRGLCGGFNNNIIKQVEAIIKQQEHNKHDYKILVLGQKIKNYFSNHYPTKIINDFSFKMDLKLFHMQQAMMTSQYIFNLFKDLQIGSLSIVYTEFISVLSNQVKNYDIFPIDFSNVLQGELLHHNPKLGLKANLTSTDTPSLAQLNVVSDDFIEEALPFIVKDLILSWVYRGVIESLASEHAARINAMDNSYNNAGDLLKKLSMEYNRTRQALITKELIEIVAGTEAL